LKRAYRAVRRGHTFAAHRFRTAFNNSVAAGLRPPQSRRTLRENGAGFVAAALARSKQPDAIVAPPPGD
jgi:hypothetical protein